MDKYIIYKRFSLIYKGKFTNNLIRENTLSFEKGPYKYLTSTLKNLVKLNKEYSNNPKIPIYGFCTEKQWKNRKKKEEEWNNLKIKYKEKPEWEQKWKFLGEGFWYLWDEEHIWKVWGNTYFTKLLYEQELIIKKLDLGVILCEFENIFNYYTSCKFFRRGMYKLN